MGRKTTADIHGGHVCYGGGVPSGKDFIKADRSVVHVLRRAVKNTAVLGSVDKREAESVHVTGAVKFALATADIPGIGKKLDEETGETANKAPDSRFVVTTDKSDPRKFTHEKSVVHGYTGCEDPGALREKSDTANETKKHTQHLTRR